MKSKNFSRVIMAATLVGGFAAAVPAQIPLPPLPPGLNVRITTGRPPAMRREMRSERPGPDYVWVSGFWTQDDGRWNWVPGRWERPVEPQAYWIGPRYNRTGRVTIYEPGHWSNQQLVVEDDVRNRSEWRRHEREHQREMERERNRDNYRDRDDRRDHDDHHDHDRQ